MRGDTGFAFVQSLVMFGLVVYLALFIYRHQIIVQAGNRFKFSVRTQISFLAILLIPYLALGPVFHVRLKQCAVLQQRRYRAKWERSVIKRIDCFPLDHYFYLLWGFDGHFAWIFIFIVAQISRHSFILLRELQMISPATQQLHRILTKSLIFQALTPVVFVIIPVSVAVFTQLPFINYHPSAMKDWVITPFDVVVVAISFHSTAHSVVLISTTPAFR
ncbi:hypothetical protein PENTCL1PPCAC_20286, partial [Pristionchus entomophagus]